MQDTIQLQWSIIAVSLGFLFLCVFGRSYWVGKTGNIVTGYQSHPHTAGVASGFFPARLHSFKQLILVWLQFGWNENL